MRVWAGVVLAGTQRLPFRLGMAARPAQQAACEGQGAIAQHRYLPPQ